MQQIRILCFFTAFLTVSSVTGYAQPEISIPGRLFTSLEKAQAYPDSVERIRLKRRRYKEIPKEIYQFGHLKELDLSANRIEKIPSELYQLKELRVIRMGRNKIHLIEPGIAQLDALQVLDLGMNPLTQIPAEIGKLKNLELLQIWGTEITSLPDEISQCPRLRYVDMRNIILTDSERETLQEQLPSVKFFLSEGCNCGK